MMHQPTYMASPETGLSGLCVSPRGFCPLLSAAELAPSPFVDQQKPPEKSRFRVSLPLGPATLDPHLPLRDSMACNCRGQKRKSKEKHLSEQEEKPASDSCPDNDGTELRFCISSRKGLHSPAKHLAFFFQSPHDREVFENPV